MRACVVQTTSPHAIRAQGQLLPAQRQRASLKTRTLRAGLTEALCRKLAVERFRGFSRLGSPFLSRPLPPKNAMSASTPDLDSALEQHYVPNLE